MKQGLSSKVVVSHNHNLVDKTLDRDISTFRNHCAAIATSDFSPDESGHLWNAGHQWTDYDVGIVALNRERRQLSKHPDPDYSILDLKSHYRGYRYACETIKMLLEKPDAICLADIFQQIARLGAIHPLLQSVASP